MSAKKAKKAKSVAVVDAEVVPTSTNERLVTTHQAAALAACHASSIVHWINDGKLKSFTTPGGHRRIRVTDLKAFLEAQGSYISAALEQAAAE